MSCSVHPAVLKPEDYLFIITDDQRMDPEKKLEPVNFLNKRLKGPVCKIKGGICWQNMAEMVLI